MVRFTSGAFCVLLIAAAGLSGCDGSTIGAVNVIDIDGEGVQQQDNSYAGLLANANNLVAGLSLLALPSAMQASGSATFNGVAGLETLQATNPESLSRISLTAKFADATVSGQFFNFADAEGAPMSGTLDVENGVIAGNSLNLDINGSLTRDEQVAVIAGAGQGKFGGEGPAAVLGTLDGTWKQGANPATPITGFFAATRALPDRKRL